MLADQPAVSARRITSATFNSRSTLRDGAEWSGFTSAGKGKEIKIKIGSSEELVGEKELIAKQA